MRTYERTVELLDKETKGKDYTLVVGYWNAVVGEGREDMFVGHYGLGSRNDRGEKLREYCKRRQMYMTNTWFTQDRRRRYTWTKPGSKSSEGLFQTDYTEWAKKLDYF